MFKTFNPPERILMGPGPSDVNPRILGALARPTIGHLDPAFIGLMDEVKDLLRYAFKTENELTIPISAPGSAGMEACFVNLVEPGDKVIVCSNGVFGGRMHENARRAGGEVLLLEHEWGKPVNPERLEQARRSSCRSPCGSGRYVCRNEGQIVEMSKSQHGNGAAIII